MSESTTTEPVAADAGVEETQPAAATPDSAVSTDESTTTTPEDQAGGVTDENLTWLQSKGIDPNDPEAMTKVAKMYRDAEKAMHESTEKASKLQKALDTPEVTQVSSPASDDPMEQLNAKMQALEMSQKVTSFWTAHPEAKEYEPTMAKMVTDNPTVGALVRTGYLSVEQLYAMAKGMDASHDSKLKTEGGREALRTVADKQQAKAVAGHATTSEMSKNETEDPFLKGLLGKT